MIYNYGQKKNIITLELRSSTKVYFFQRKIFTGYTDIMNQVKRSRRRKDTIAYLHHRLSKEVSGIRAGKSARSVGRKDGGVKH